MNPALPPVMVPGPVEPNVALLLRAGWSFNAVSGDYCLAWRGNEEALFVWTGDGWLRAGR